MQMGKHKHVCGWGWETSSVLYDNHHLTAAAALLPAQYLFQRCCLLLIMSVGADLSFGDPLWKFKLQFGPVFFLFLSDF